MYLSLAEEEFGTGFVLHPFDERMMPYDVLAKGVEELFDWNEGCDIEKVMGGKIKVKNQKKSLSCVGQAWSYYSWVLQVIEAMKLTGLNLEELRANQPELVEEHSGKSIYSQIFLPTGGAFVTSGGDILTGWGMLTEEKVPSVIPDGIEPEAFMRDTMWKNENSNWFAERLKNKGYCRVPAKMEDVAKAIKLNNGVVLAVNGSNNGTWRTLNPKPPKLGENTWSHLMYFGKACMADDGRKTVCTPNSWGDLGGWQELGEDYFDSGNVTMCVTLVDKPSTLTVRLYFVNPDTKQPIYRDLPMDQPLQIQGFTKTGWSFKVIPGATRG